MAVRSGDWKLVRYDTNADSQTGKAQPVTSIKLYHLAKDTHEDNDLSSTMPDKVAELQKLWDEWNKGQCRATLGQRQCGQEKRSAKRESEVTLHLLSFNFLSDGPILCRALRRSKRASLSTS